MIRTEWRTNGDRDAILVVDAGDDTVLAAYPVDSVGLSAFLISSQLPFASARGTGDCGVRPDDWGEAVLSRAATGEILFIEPELYWDRIHLLYRSRGVDYDALPHTLAGPLPNNMRIGTDMELDKGTGTSSQAPRDSPVSVPFRELPAGTILRLKSGATAEVLANPGDGAWLLVKIVESDANHVEEGSEEMVFFTDVEGIR